MARIEAVRHREGPPLSLEEVGTVVVLEDWDELRDWTPGAECVLVWGTDSDFARVAQAVHRRKMKVSLIPMPLGPMASIARALYGDREPAEIVEAVRDSSRTQKLSSMKVSDTLLAGPQIAFSLGLGWPERAGSMLDAMDNEPGMEKLAARLARGGMRAETLGATVEVDGEPVASPVEALQVSSLSRTWPGVTFQRSGSRLGVVAVDSLTDWLKTTTRLGRLLSRGDAGASCSTIHIDVDARYVVDSKVRESGSRVLRIEPGPEFVVRVPG